MAAPIDPFPNFVPGALADGDQVDARFAALFAALDRSKPSGGLDAASIKDAIVVPGLTVIDAWQSVPMHASLANTLEFYKDITGLVHFKPKTIPLPGASGSVPAAATVAALPAGFFPGVLEVIQFSWIVGTSSIGSGRFNLDTGGVMAGAAADGALSWGSSGQYLVFHGSSYRAEA